MLLPYAMLLVRYRAMSSLYYLIQVISHSRSFDHRRLARLPLTAIASAFRCPTRRLPRGTPV